MDFRHLMSPIKINKYTLKNRIVSAPMIFGLAGLHASARDAQLRKIEDRAKGGAALINIGETGVNFDEANRVPIPFCDFTDYSSEAFRLVKRYAEIIHESGAIACMELNHPGAEKNPFAGQPNPVGPVGYVKPNGVIVKELDERGMARITRDFAAAAKFMTEAGFDGIIVHGGHGFLITQFLSTRINTRTDCYGGSLENRARFPLQIMKSIRETIGQGKILDIRLSGEDGQGGITAEDTGEFCRMLEGIADCVHISCGIYSDPVKTHQLSSMYDKHGVNAKTAAIIKRRTSLPVGVIGGINSPEQAEEIIASGQADMVVLGRQMIADPEFPNKLAAGQTELIRRCVRCYTCFPGSPEEGYTDLPFGSEQLMKTSGYCAINPLSGRPKPVPAQMPKRVLVIGGGIAGMQAAITLSDRGHHVTLAEKSDKLGGILNFTDVDVNKEDLRNFKNVIVRELLNSTVKVLLEAEVNEEEIAKLEPDFAVLATGALPVKPEIEGIETARSAVDIYFGYTPEKRVVIIGGGLVGCETALHLQKTGHQVTVIEMLDMLAAEAYGMYRQALMLEMERVGIKSVTCAKCLSMSKNSAVIEVGGVRRELTCDSVIYALGMKSVNTDALKAALDDIPWFTVGDAAKPGKIDAAMKSAFDVAQIIN